MDPSGFWISNILLVGDVDSALRILVEFWYSCLFPRIPLLIIDIGTLPIRGFRSVVRHRSSTIFRRLNLYGFRIMFMQESNLGFQGLLNTVWVAPHSLEGAILPSSTLLGAEGVPTRMGGTVMRNASSFFFLGFYPLHGLSAEVALSPTEMRSKAISLTVLLPFCSHDNGSEEIHMPRDSLVRLQRLYYSWICQVQDVDTYHPSGIALASKVYSASRQGEISSKEMYGLAYTG